MIVKVGSHPNYDDVFIDEKSESMIFEELPGRPVLTFEPEGRITIRMDGSAEGVMVVMPNASNSVTIGARK